MPDPIRVVIIIAASAGIKLFPETIGAIRVGKPDFRIDEAAGRGYVRAKTGTLLKVSSLSGVTTTEDGRLLVYSFVVNDLTDLTAAKDMLDRSAAALTRL